MKTLLSAAITDYATGYAEGRHAAKEHLPAYANPFPRSSPAYQAWIDGHYDERSARSVQIERNSAAIWERER
jgi:hypothetical protein